MGKPLSGSKTFGNVILRPPQFEHDLFGTVCGTSESWNPKSAALLLLCSHPLTAPAIVTFLHAFARGPAQRALLGARRVNVKLLVWQGEAKLMLKREEKGGLNVSLKQLNAIVRL